MSKLWHQWSFRTVHKETHASQLVSDRYILQLHKRVVFNVYYCNNGGKATCCTFSAAGCWTIYWWAESTHYHQNSFYYTDALDARKWYIINGIHTSNREVMHFHNKHVHIHRVVSCMYAIYSRHCTMEFQMCVPILRMHNSVAQSQYSVHTYAHPASGVARTWV